MAEYIEREALIKFIESHFPYRCSCDFYDGQKDCINQINAFPAADVVEVLHGEWKEIDNIVIENGMLTVKGTTWCCNVCGEARKTLTKPNMNYCPNCGAKMDAERKCEDA